MRTRLPSPLIGLVAAALLAGARSPALAVSAPGASGFASPCKATAISVREVAVTPGPSAAYALKNRGSAACRISGGVGIRLFDARGKQIPLRFAPRTMMAMLLTLAPGAEASFTVSYAPYSVTTALACVKAARIQVFIPPQLALAAVRTSFAACNGPLVRVSNLRLGVPEAQPSASPAALSSQSPVPSPSAASSPAAVASPSTVQLPSP